MSVHKPVALLRGVTPVLALIVLAYAYGAHADVFRPAYLELHESGADHYEVMWKVPAQGDLRLAVNVTFPPGTIDITPPRGQFIGNAYVERWQISRPAGLNGQTIGIEGIANGVTDVIARIVRQDGTSQVERVMPDQPRFTVKAPAGAGEVAWTYLVLGVEHILGGIDHLLFVAGLLFLVGFRRRLIGTITAFTLAHSITLACSAFGWITLRPPPVEATIAMSIVLVASEALRERDTLARRVPALVSFLFGLVHGLGFAGALKNIGLPQSHLPLALLCFNVGVEIGQLFAVLVAFAVVRLPFSQPWLGRARRPALYAIGVVAAYWSFLRIAAIAS